MKDEEGMFTTLAGSLLLLMQAGSFQEEIYVFEGDDPFARGVKMYRYEGALRDADPERTIVCRDVMELGSKLPSRLCRKLSDWEDIYEANQDEIEQKRRSPRSSGQKGGAGSEDSSSSS